MQEDLLRQIVTSVREEERRVNEHSGIAALVIMDRRMVIYLAQTTKMSNFWSRLSAVLRSGAVDTTNCPPATGGRTARTWSGSLA
jgi:hypothetical protein